MSKCLVVFTWIRHSESLFVLVHIHILLPSSAHKETSLRGITVGWKLTRILLLLIGGSLKSPHINPCETCYKKYKSQIFSQKSESSCCQFGRLQSSLITIALRSIIFSRKLPADAIIK
jgi:hypothetical protein